MYEGFEDKKKAHSDDALIKMKVKMAGQVMFYKKGIWFPEIVPHLQTLEPELQAFIAEYYKNHPLPETHEDAYYDAVELMYTIRTQGNDAVNVRLDELIDEANDEAERDKRKSFLRELVENFGLGIIPEEEVEILTEKNFAEYELVDKLYSFKASFAKKIMRAWFLENYEKKEK